MMLQLTSGPGDLSGMSWTQSGGRISKCIDRWFGVRAAVGTQISVADDSDSDLIRQ
jgi:hypothetical protein